MIRKMIDDMLEERAHGDPVGIAALRVKLLLKGIDPDEYTRASEDDPAVLAKLQQMKMDFEAQGGRR